MKSFVSGVTTLGVALLVPAATCAASTIFLSGVSTVTHRFLSMVQLKLAAFQNLSEPTAMFLLGGALFGLATLVHLTAKKPVLAGAPPPAEMQDSLPIPAVGEQTEKSMRVGQTARFPS